MALFTTEQNNAIAAAKASILVVQTALNQMTALIEYLQNADSNPLVAGKISAEAVFADGVAQWATGKAAVIAAANALS